MKQSSKLYSMHAELTRGTAPTSTESGVSDKLLTLTEQVTRLNEMIYECFKLMLAEDSALVPFSEKSTSPRHPVF